MSYYGYNPPSPTVRVLNEVEAERMRQNELWGQQDLPSGTGGTHWSERVRHAQEMCELARKRGMMTHRHVLLEEVYEAFAEVDPVRLRAELIQVAAVAVKWIEQLDRDS
jgi:hypothetical protein